MAKKKSGLGNVLVNLLMVVPSLLKIATHFVSCIEHEAGLAKKSIIILSFLFIIALSLTTITWCCLCAIIFLLLISWQISWIVSLSIILAINILLLIITGLSITKAKNNLFFPETRKLFH